MLTTLLAQATENPFGQVSPPPGVASFNEQVGDGGIGIFIFIDNLVTIFTVVAGLWVMFNFLLAGFSYITGSGDSSSHQKVRDLITMSVIGLVIMVSAYTIIGILGLLFFGEAGYFLNPTITGPGGGV
jgi:hypothetical protein